MSLSSWKKEFYPITAIKAAKGGDIAATEHSLKKWTGALPAALKRHGGAVVEIKAEWQYGKEFKFSTARFCFGPDECALCVRHFDRSAYACGDCPIAGAGFLTCPERDSAYDAFALTGNPRPMIAVLRKTLAWLKKQKRAA